MAESQNLQPTQVIAKIFGVSTRRIEQLKAEGVIVGQGRPTKYDLLPTIQKYIRYLSDRAYGREQKEGAAETEKQKQEAEAELKQYKAKITKMQLDELEGTMHRSEDVEAVMNDLVYSIRAQLLALPGRLAVDVSQVKNANEAAVLIRSECYNILEELSRYKYDPEEYKRRVRDREGWSAALADEEDDE